MDDELHFEVDLSTMTIDDMEILDMSKESVRVRDFLDVLDRIVIGGVRGKGYKIVTLQTIARTINDAIMAQVNPTVRGKN